MMLDATSAAVLILEAVESGANAVTLLSVTPGADAARRLLLVVQADGNEQRHGTLGGPERDAAGVELARSALADPRHQDGLVTLPGIAEVYVEVRRVVQDLVIVGAGHIALPISRIGADLGFRVWVLDDRPEFATRERFPTAYRVLRADFSDPFRDVPVGEGTHVLLVTRAHRYDYDCLVKALRCDPAPAYIGMLGSRRRVRATFAQLLEEGISRSRLADIHSPVGLDIGAETPEEIAVAVAAELVKVRRGGTGASLRDIERVTDRYFEEGSES